MKNASIVSEELMNQFNGYAGGPKKDGNFTKDCAMRKKLKTALLKTFGDDIMITSTKTHGLVVCFLGTGYKILSEKFYKEM